MEYKAVPLVDLQIDDRVVKSVMAVMGSIDLVGDRIHNGAFTKTIKERFASGGIKVLWQHDKDEPPVGVPLEVKEIGRDDLPNEIRQRYPDSTGALYAEIKYLDTPRGNEILTGIREGAITENSIGYNAIKKDFEAHPQYRQVRNLREIMLGDLSPVNFGAHPATMNLKAAKEFEDAQIAALDEFLSDLKAGRVLSTANLAKLKAALATLSDILLVAEPPEDEPKALTAHGLLHRLAIAERELTVIA